MRLFEVFFQARLVEVGLVATRGIEDTGQQRGVDLLLEDAGVLRALDLHCWQGVG